jgi:hypothetical protein
VQFEGTNEGFQQMYGTDAPGKKQLRTETDVEAAGIILHGPAIDGMDEFLEGKGTIAREQHPYLFNTIDGAHRAVGAKELWNENNPTGNIFQFYVSFSLSLSLSVFSLSLLNVCFCSFIVMCTAVICPPGFE